MIDVVAGLFFSGDQVLVARRKPGTRNGGEWEFPGGKVYPGESHDEALVREIREEFSVGCRAGSIFLVTVCVVEVETIRLWVLRATLEGRVTNSTDHDQIRWVTREELRSLPFSRPDRDVVRLIGQINASGEIGAE